MRRIDRELLRFVLVGARDVARKTRLTESIRATLGQSPPSANIRAPAQYVDDPALQEQLRNDAAELFDLDVTEIQLVDQIVETLAAVLEN